MTSGPVPPAANGPDDTRGRTRNRVVGWFAGVLIVLGAASLTPPQWRLAGLPVLLQLAALPLLTGLVWLIVAAILAVAARRGVLRWMAVLLVALLGVGHALVAVGRGWWSEQGAIQPGDVTVFSYNAQHQLLLTTEMLTAVQLRHPLVISLPEVDRQVAQDLATRAVAWGLNYQVFSELTTDSPPSVTSLLVDRSLGDYEVDPADTQSDGLVRVRPTSGPGPEIIAVHPVSPRLSLTSQLWRREGALPIALCKQTANVIVAGDFNATTAHPQFADLGHCRDAATEVERSGEGTWPSMLPTPFAAAIDHVLSDEPHWHTVSFHTEVVGASDHRMVVVVLRPQQ